MSNHNSLLACVFLLFASCSPASSTCEYCGRQDAKHGSFTSSPEWVWGEYESAIREALAAETAPQRLDPKLTCPKSFGPLPPAGKVRVLAPIQTRDEPDHKEWQWTIVSSEVFASGMVEMGRVRIHGRPENNPVGSIGDYVWSFTLEVTGERKETGYELSYAEVIRPMHGGSSGRVERAQMATEGHGVEALAEVSAGELLVDVPGSATLATVDGNVIQLHLADTVESIKEGGAPR